jgi:four helix bundle protein
MIRKRGNKEFIQFLNVAKGSCSEYRYQSYRAFNYQYINQDILDDLIKHTVRLNKKISSLMSHLKKSNLKGSKFVSLEP